MAQPWGQGWEQLARGCGRQERCRAGSYAEMVLEVRKRMYPIHLKHAPQGNLGCNIESQTGEEKVACYAHQKCTKMDPKWTLEGKKEILSPS